MRIKQTGKKSIIRRGPVNHRGDRKALIDHDVLRIGLAHMKNDILSI